MRNTQRKSLFLLMTMVLLCPALFADQVSLKNGDRLTGTIVKSDAKTLVLKTEAAGDVTFQWSAIDAITSTQPLHVGLAGGQIVVGPVATKDGQIQVTTLTGGSRDRLEGFGSGHPVRLGASHLRRGDGTIAAPAPRRLLERDARYRPQPHARQFGHPFLHSRGKGGAPDGSRQNHGLYHCGVWEK